MNIIKNLFLKAPIHWVLFCALVVRLGAWAVLPNLEFFDFKRYVSAGESLFTGQIDSHIIMPLHPILVSVSEATIGIKPVNILLGVLLVFLIYSLCKELFKDERAAKIAAWIASVYPFFIFYSITGLTEVPFTCLLIAAFYFLYKSKFFVASIILVLMVLYRPSLDLLNPILVVTFAAFVHRMSFKETVYKTFQFLAIYIVLMTPWWIHQYKKYDQFVRLNLGDGVVWYAGNDPLNQSGGGVTGRGKGDDMDLSHFQGIDDPLVQNQAMKNEAFKFIKENPKRFLYLAYLKFKRFWRLWPYDKEYEKPIYIIASIFSYGTVLVLSFLFTVKNFKNSWKHLSPIYLTVLYYTIIHCMLIASIRYRFPLEPFLVLLASYGIAIYMRKWQNTESSLERN